MTRSPQHSIWRSLIVLLGVIVLIVAALLFLASRQERNLASLREQELEYHLASTATLGQLQRHLRAVELGAYGLPVPGYFGDTRFRGVPASALYAMAESVERLVVLQGARGVAGFERTVRRVRAQHASLVQALERARDSTDPGAVWTAIESFGLTLEQLSRLHNQATAKAHARFDEGSRHARAVRLVILAGGAVLAMLASAFFLVQIRASLRRLEAAEGALRDLNADLEQRVEERAAALERAQGQLVRAERLAAIGQLTATVAHELRNPLGTIQASSDVLRRAVEDPPPRLARAIGRIERNIARCVTVINQLLTFGQVREGCFAPVTLDRLIRTVLGERDLPEGVRARLELHSASVVWADAERLRQAVVNVVDNAVHALTERDLPAASPILEVSTRQVDGFVEIRIADNGPGVPAAIRDRIFEPLVSGRSFGVGLGLPLVMNIATEHGGSVEVHDGAHGGTVVTLRLPTHESAG